MTGPQDPFATPDPNDPPQPPQQGSGQQQPPAYGQPYGSAPTGQPFGTPPASSGGNGLAIGALVLGLLSLVTWFFLVGAFLGIAAVVMGVIARGRARKGQGSGSGLALAGIITGVIGVLLTALVVVGAVALFNSGDFSNLTECLQDAGSDQDALDDCAREFEDSVG